jgi:rhodanese-related sulfurtransferase
MKQHTTRFLQLVQDAQTRIQELTPQQLKEKLAHNEIAYLVDVRDKEECAIGQIPGSIHLSKGVIERDIEKQIPDVAASIAVYCSGGFRCALVADSLQKMGYTHVYSLAGGLSAWIAAGYPIDK